MKLIDYIQGKRHGKEANRLEREALNDPFLQDAIEGFDAVPGDHLTSINQLEEELKRRITRKPRVIEYRWWAVGIAASLILVLGIGSLMRLEMHVPENTALQAPKVVIPAKAASDSIVLQNEKPEKKTIAQHISKPKASNTREVVTSVIESTNAAKNESVEHKEKTSENVLQTLEVNAIALKPADSAGVEKTIPSAAENALQGRVAGVAVTRNSGYSKFSKDKQLQSELAALRNSGKINGKVLDENGEPLIGATVRIKGHSEGTITDIHGNFELKIPVKGKVVLETGYIGYEKKEVALTDNLNKIKLKPNDIALNEIVVVGYGTVKKSDMTGAISSPRSNKSFGENEFKTYYQKHRTAGLCDTTRLIMKANFRIDFSGKATDITVKKAPCPEMEQEFIKCLQNSPVWTEKNRKVRLTIRF